MNSNQNELTPAHEELIQFLYQAPIGLVQVTPDGEITMINPMSAQLLMPLSPDGNLSNLFDVLSAQAPQLGAQVAAFNADSGMICDGLYLEAGTMLRPLTLSLRLLKLGDLSLMACLTDVTAAVVRNAQRLALQLRKAARTDSLTDLPNRAVVMDRLTHLLERVKGGDSEQFAVFFLNCDGFIRINDAYGRSIGDDLLRLMADRLTSTLRPSDTIDSGHAGGRTAARLSGDEFVVLLEDLSSADAAHRVAQRLVDLLCRPYVVGEHKVHLTVSMGVVLCAQAVDDADEVLLNASIAMQEAKRAGGGRYWIFEPEMRARATRRGSLEAELRIALSSGELFVVYQPQVSLSDGRCTGVEALVRWLHPVRGVVSPDEFIALAEETGLIDTLGEYVLNEACRQFVSWQTMLADQAPLKMSVNVSRAQLADPHLPSRVQQALRLSTMKAQQLQLEVTESLAAQDSQVQVRLHELKALGVTLSLDDFGTGYSSLSSLSLLPVDVIKIDRSFVCQAESSAHHRVLIEATILVARSLGMGTVAEGIETIGEARLLQQLKCDVGQGYLYSKPLAAAEATRWLTTRAVACTLGQDQD